MNIGETYYHKCGHWPKALSATVTKVDDEYVYLAEPAIPRQVQVFWQTPIENFEHNWRTEAEADAAIVARAATGHDASKTQIRTFRDKSL